VKRLFGNLFVIALVAAVVSFFAAPAVAFFAIRSAADANDAAGLERLIDYAAVRRSLRPQLSGNPAATAPAPSFLEDPIGAVRRQLEPAVVGAPDPDVYLTPAALAALSRGEGRDASQHTGPVVQAEAADPMPRPVFWGINRARLSVTDEGGTATVFTFERKGPFEWKLVHVGLPDRVTSPAAGSATAG
tara:strand:- start:32588 stop:33154 length:567 start_codon:yes stop_codon:yes gene_type:complete